MSLPALRCLVPSLLGLHLLPLIFDLLNQLREQSQLLHVCSPLLVGVTNLVDRLRLSWEYRGEHDVVSPQLHGLFRGRKSQQIQCGASDDEIGSHALQDDRQEFDLH